MFRSAASGLRFRVSLLIIVALLPAVVLNVYSALQQRRWVAQELQLGALELVRSVADRQVQLTAGVQETLTSLAMVPAIRTADPAECPALLADVLRQFPHYTSLSVINPEGRLVCRGLTVGDAVTVDGLAVESAFRRAMSTGAFAIGSYAIGTVTRKPVVPFALPIRDREGGVRAVLTTTLDLVWLDQYASGSDFLPGAALTVLDASGTVLARYPDPEHWVGTRVPGASEVQHLLDGPGEQEGVSQSRGLDGVLRLYAFSRLPAAEGAPVVVTLGVSQAEAFAPANQRLARDLIVLLLIGAIAMGAGWMIGTRTILAPIRSLLCATRRLAAGDLTARASNDARAGELAELSLSFNEMAGALQQRTADIATSLAALKQSEERYRSLVEASAAIVWNTPASGNFETPQPRWSEFTGQTFGELRGWGWIQAIHPDDRARVAEAWTLVADSGALYQMEQRLRRHDGEFRHMLVRAVPIFGDEGELREWVGVHTDITDRKRAEMERQALLTREQEARVEAEEANRAKSDFMAIISHELRTPLASIISYTELLALDGGDPLSCTQREFLERIDGSAWHLKELVDQILEFARLEAGRLSLDVAETDLSALVRDSVADMSPLAQLKGLSLQAVTPAVPVTVHTDPTKTKQILLNLLSNAIKFSTDGEVRVEVAPTPCGARIRVQDNGPGIDPEHLARIWEMFWQAENPLTRRVGGAGLGLAIVRRLADLLGGTVGVESHPGEGSTFTIALPMSVPRATRDAVARTGA